MAPTHPALAFKTLFRVLVEHVGGLDAAAACTRVQRARLSHYQSLPQDDCFVPVDVLDRLEEIAGEPILTKELARRRRCALVPVEPVADGELAAFLARVGSGSGEVFAAYAEAMADDGQVDDAEKAVIARKLNDLIRAAHFALGHLQGGRVSSALAVLETGARA